ncbi:hypothetical protein EDB81DRAFT_320069 [Dactylonectria macrodidyma]|uniref:F-box domain-containing protein n=1 Tax=Dactylonectria macrodidyma TaxID=307937 RepID=A0A9P9FCY6_9HYPO|nr:hypothetical protein EDB81DRAFT_320069 [Dactylonectria macrodidyma]
MTPLTSEALVLTGLPVEILLDIYHQLSLDDVFSLAATHRTLLDLFTQAKASILLPVLSRDFSPFDELLQVYTASEGDLESPGGLYTPRRIVYQRHAGDGGSLLAPRSEHLPVDVAESCDGFTHFSKARKPNATPSQALKTVILTECDLGPLLKYCQLVRRWEELFPQMRWFHESENCRLLRPHEGERFRRAFYRWWLYGFYFHGELPRPRVGLPEPYVDDIRTSQMRRHSTNDLLELMDLVETMKDVVLHYLCPRLDPYQHDDAWDLPLIDTIDRPQSMMTGWNDQSRWGRIVKTYAKLGPKELIHLFENIYSYPRERLIVEARLHHANFTLDQESIQIAIRCALDERRWLDNMPSLPEDGVGGVIDFDDERDGERLVFGGDARLDGSLPPGAKFVRSISQYSPRGDDGSHLNESQHQNWADGRSMVPSVR